MNNYSDAIKLATAKLCAKEEAAREDMETLLIGKRVRILETWRDQAVGKSRTDWKGRIVLITGCGFGTAAQGAYIFVSGARHAVPLKIVEFMSIRDFWVQQKKAEHCK